jgi:hypothetical protein
MDDLFVKFALSLLSMGVGTILLRVWKIPAMEEKLDRVIHETDRNRDRIHEINNTLHVHDLRISALEKAKQETRKF